jgi:8-oxo-dGTP pyrophosphatase MutT (NUDIX family)
MNDHAVLRDQLAHKHPLDERESQSIERTLERLSWPGDPYSEEESDHHVTASAFVVSSRGVILHRHRRLDMWLQPGGHVDAGEGPPDAARRETLEETGLIARHLVPVNLFHVDVHPGPRGHTHYDLRYVLVAALADPSPALDESPDVFWFDFVTAQTRCAPDLVTVLAALGQVYETFDVRD